MSVQYPARGARLREDPCHSIEQLVADIQPALMAHSDVPFGLFGHSMGAAVAFELTCRLIESGARPPLHLFVSGRRSPQSSGRVRALHALADAEFLASIADMNGTPPAVLENAELMQLLMPALRADFAASESWRYQSGRQINIPLTIFGGDADPYVPVPELSPWSQVTTAPSEVQVLPGDHFFLHQHFPIILKTICGSLAAATE